jgi:subtilisin family serine protease
LRESCRNREPEIWKADVLRRLRKCLVFLGTIIAFGAVTIASAVAQGKFQGPGGLQGVGGPSYGIGGQDGAVRRRKPPGPFISPSQDSRPISRSQLIERPPKSPRRAPPSVTRPGPSGAPPANERRLIPNEVLAQVQNNISQQALDAIAQRNRLTLLETQSFELTGSTLARWRIPDRRSAATVVRQLESDPAVIAVQPNYLYTLRQTDRRKLNKGDPTQYELAKLQLPRAHGITKGDGVVVAVLDSGVDKSHPDLDGSIIGTYDTDQFPAALHKHGTSVAALIAAHGKLVGSAPNARILSVRVMNAAGMGGTLNVLKGLDWASKNGARVINMSFAGPRDLFCQQFLHAAYLKGIVLVAAVGNDGPTSPPLYPAAFPDVIGVTATDAKDRLYVRANQGDQVAVAAPGVDLMLATPGGEYHADSGTSYAAPQISGIVALLLARKPHLSPDQVRAVLQSTARDLGPKGRDRLFGSGLGDAHGALLAADPILPVQAGAR